MAHLAVDVRPRGLRAHLVSGLFLLASGLTSPAMASENEPYPASISQPPSQLHLPTTLVVDLQPAPTNVAQWPVHRHQQNELRRRRAKRQDDGDDEDEEGTSTRTSTERTTSTSDEERETETANEDDDEDNGDEEEDNNEDEDDDARPTQTITDDVDSFLTFTVSLEPSPTVTEDPEDSPLPSAFDTTMMSEFQGEDEDDSCSTFMSSLLNSQTYLDCYPLSMMFRTSTSFFRAKRSLESTVRVLEESCGADITTCSDFMSEAATNLTEEENCGAEFDDRLSKVMAAYRGLVNYELIYSVSCLQDPDTDMYCYANAVTNLSTASDALLYYLPYDESLPGSSTPSCNWCNEETMAVFHAASADRDQAIANTYEDAARQVNSICGPTFVNDTLPEAVESAAWAVTSTGPYWAVTLVMSLTVALAVGDFIGGTVP